MGRGDKRTKKGKITAGSFGNARPRKANKTTVVKKEEKKTEAEAK